ncbi:AraC family transcriptional regulator [Petroclostridium sp. X23]|uniref:AraC family transcriptional regulator n=1 Tax=Petroclostridium sp. X23 TaxID=3045146 RepID=UPI0024AD8077|nr:AraC family transcriptional regulator [Petroclostridium sp. X23]WHH58542.1 AraC family transcriptional regulator [Petroclostridium sp. X23]
MNFLPQSFKIFKMNSIFIRLLLGFTGFILISILLVGATSYTTSSKSLLDEVKKSNILILKQARDSIDKEIARVNDISVKIAVNKQINKASYFSRDESASDLDVYSEISQYLNSLKSTNDLYSNIWIKFNKSNKIVNFEDIYEEHAFFSDVCVYKSNLEWDKIFNGYYAFSTIGRQEIYFNYTSRPVVVFVRSIPIGDIVPLGTVVINMDEKVLSSAIQNMDKNNPILTYIVDSNNNIVFCNDNQYTYNVDDKLFDEVDSIIAQDKEGEVNTVIDGREYTVEFISSNVNDWRYITLIPNSFITSKVNNIRNITIVIIIISFIVGSVLSYILVKKIYNPINKIISYLNIINNNKRIGKEKDKSNDEFAFINNIINYVYSENKSLKESYNKSIPMLKEKILSDLLDGKVNDLKFKELCENIGINLPYNLFQVIVFEIDDYLNLDKGVQKRLYSEIVQAIESIALKVFQNSAKIYLIKKGKDKDKVVAIINDEESSQDTGISNEFFDEVIKYFGQNYGITFTIGIGKAYASYEKCSMSFIEALFALKYKVVKGDNTIIHIDEVSDIPTNTFEYPIETERHLINKLKSGDIKSITSILEETLVKNLNNSNASPEMVNNFFNALIGTLVRTIYEMQSTVKEVFQSEYDLYNEISVKSTITEKKGYILFLFKTVTEFVNKRKVSNNLKVYEKVIKFIDENYQSELSLDNVSEVVGLSPSYLSLVFKEVSGINFVEYVNRYRIMKAKTYLNDISLTVSQISNKVGYINSNTFIKVFKKYEGITPGQFREMYKK